VPKDLLAGFDGGESGMSPRLLGGDSINLLGVKDGVDAMDKPGFRLPPVLFMVRAVTGGERLAVFGIGPFLPLPRSPRACSLVLAPPPPALSIRWLFFVCSAPSPDLQPLGGPPTPSG